MTDLLVTTVEILRIALGTMILGSFLWLFWKTLRLRPDFIMTRAILQPKRSLRIAVLLTLGILFQLTSTGIELYVSVSAGAPESVEFVNEVIEALTLLLFLAALAFFIPIVWVPSSAIRSSKQG